MFQTHRDALIARLNGHAAVFFSAPETIRNRDVGHRYRQDSDLWYLTGFKEPGSVLVLAPQKDEGERVVMFVRPADPEKEVWTGKRLGADAAPEALGVDLAYSLDDLATKLPELLHGVRGVYFDQGRNADDDAVVRGAIAAARRARRTGVETPGDVLDPAPLLHEQRMIKGEAEIDAMRRAGALCAEGHEAAMRIAKPGLYEYSLQAELEYVWQRAGSPRVAFETIAAAGANACTLHYEDNDAELKDGDLVLIDAGCEVDYYAADVSRTWPVNGRFSPAQRELYTLVLDAQKAGIARCKPGYSFEAVHQASVQVLTEGMVRLGLIEGPIDEAISEERYKRFYMHKTGHWLGLDVHDVGAYFVSGTSRALEAGVVLTVEPGIYIPPDDAQAPAQYRGIGIRIEDDILVTNGAPEVLTAAAPKEIDDLEAIIGRCT